MGKIEIEAQDEDLLNDILTSISSHFNNKQDNFELRCIGFKVEHE
jgi:hypothetical protein